MTTLKIEFESPDDHACVEKLAEIAFGPGRFARTAFRIREKAKPDPNLCFVARMDDKIVGSVKLTHILVGETPSCILGPLVVTPEMKNCGVGGKLMERAVEAAREAGETSIILVGDLSYYQRFGFEIIPRGSVIMPGPVDPDRLLVCYLSDDAARVEGMVTTQDQYI